MSPHGSDDAVVVSGHASLDGFGIDVTFAVAVDEAASRAVAEACGLRLSDEALDHGVSIPLRLTAWSGPVVAVSCREVTPQDVGRAREALHLAKRVARGIEEIATERDVAVIASMNGAVGLSPRAPLPDSSEAHAFERAVVNLLENDPGQIGAYALEVARNGNSCGVVPLLVFGHLFGDRRTEVIAHEAPIGIGYLVAQTT